jgi:hypothetical protein
MMGTRRKKKSGRFSAVISAEVARPEPTITQNGALYQVQHRQPSLPPAGIFSRLNFKNAKPRKIVEATFFSPLAPAEPVEPASSS